VTLREYERNLRALSADQLVAILSHSINKPKPRQPPSGTQTPQNEPKQEAPKKEQKTEQGKDAPAEGEANEDGPGEMDVD
jgi:hypothetical protein